MCSSSIPPLKNHSPPAPRFFQHATSIFTAPQAVSTVNNDCNTAATIRDVSRKSVRFLCRSSERRRGEPLGQGHHARRLLLEWKPAAGERCQHEHSSGPLFRPRKGAHQIRVYIGAAVQGCGCGTAFSAGHEGTWALLRRGQGNSVSSRTHCNTLTSIFTDSKRPSF